MRQRAADVNTVRGDGDTALQQRAEPLHQLGWPGGQIGQGALSDPAILAKALAQQDSGGELRLGMDSMYMAPLSTL